MDRRIVSCRCNEGRRGKCESGPVRREGVSPQLDVVLDFTEQAFPDRDDREFRFVLPVEDGSRVIAPVCGDTNPPFAAVTNLVVAVRVERGDACEVVSAVRAVVPALTCDWFRGHVGLLTLFCAYHNRMLAQQL